MVDADGMADIVREATAWRRDFHTHPEIMYEVRRTAGLVAERLRAFGCDEVATGIGRTGVVGLVRGRIDAPAPRTIALRADMDALPIAEETNLPYASREPGRMHACGHDGHTAMLLGAAKALCDTRNFAGTAALVFQPAEEGGAGARAMIEDGLMERFAVAEVYGMHNLPGLPVGAFSLCPGPIMAAADRFDIVVEGRGGHAAYPNQCIDPVLAGSQIVVALQAIVSRNMDPLAACVVSVTQFHAGVVNNAIPPKATLGGTVRTLTAETRDLAEARLRVTATNVAQAFGATATVAYRRGYPVTRNHPAQAAFAATVAGRVAGEGAGVDPAMAPIMGAEDFSYMLESRPGAFVFVGNGQTAGLHHPGYDFNDAALSFGIRYWLDLVEAALPA